DWRTVYLTLISMLLLLLLLMHRRISADLFRVKALETPNFAYCDPDYFIPPNHSKHRNPI
ncbi:MAG TPA: hypothetical protein VK553_03205, partial [Candidatus Nitrosopolaris rasttigaisensis]|nr:hypothetical protein [Candidatus Nitrosopolaris rasttigaisensis]